MVKHKEVISKVKDLAAQLASGDTHKNDADAPSWVAHVAVLTGVLAALTGFLSVRATGLTNKAIYESNQAILSQTQASDAWAEYQANSIKARMVELQLLPSNHISEEDRTKLTEMDKDLRDRQVPSKQTAETKGQEREDHLKTGLKHLQQKDLLDYAGMIAQMGIALASVAALTRQKIAFNAGIGVGVVAVLLTAYALFF